MARMPAAQHRPDHSEAHESDGEHADLMGGARGTPQHEIPGAPRPATCGILAHLFPGTRRGGSTGLTARTGKTSGQQD